MGAEETRELGLERHSSCACQSARKKKMKIFVYEWQFTRSFGTDRTIQHVVIAKDRKQADRIILKNKDHIRPFFEGVSHFYLSYPVDGHFRYFDVTEREIKPGFII